MSMLNVHASCPCYMSRCLSIMHVHFAYPLCMPMLQDRATWPWSKSMLHIHVSMLHIHVVCPCCMSMLHVYAACPRCMSMLLVHTACPTSCMSMVTSSVRYSICSGSWGGISHMYRCLRRRYIIIPHFQAPLPMPSSYLQWRLRWYITHVPAFETTVHNNSASSSAATNWQLYLTMKGKSADFLMTSVAALEEAELLCTVTSDTGTGTIIPPQVPLPCMCTGAWSQPDSLK